MDNGKAGQIALNYAMLRGAADVADHWLQTDGQARCKGWHKGESAKMQVVTADGPAEVDIQLAESDELVGRIKCAEHVASYVATQGVAVALATKASGRRLNGKWFAAGLALSAVTHYVADRRRPLRKVAEAIPGKKNFLNLASGGLNGAYLLDQAWHHGFETVASVVMAIGSKAE